MKAAVWNVHESANGNGRIDAQLERIGEWDVDVLMLRAVRRSWLEHWREGLGELGFESVLDTAGWADVLAESREWPHDGRAHHKVAITASRWPARKTGIEVSGEAYREAGLVFPERILVSEVELPGDEGTELECWNVGVVPGVSMGEEKIRMFEWVYEQLARRAEDPRLLAGDFNSPRTEKNGEKIPWGHDKPEYLRDRWQAAESNVLNGLEEWGFRDAFTVCNGTDLVDPETGEYREGCYSHLNPIGGSEPTRRRYDHVYVSGLEAVEAEYDTTVMEARRGVEGWSYLSDHAGLVVELEG